MHQHNLFFIVEKVGELKGNLHSESNIKLYNQTLKYLVICNILVLFTFRSANRKQKNVYTNIVIHLDEVGKFCIVLWLSS